MLGDGAMNLYYEGIIDNTMKSFDKDVMVANFVMGSKELYEFCDPCEDIVRTNNSISFTRKGKSFEISLINPVHNEKKMSYPFKVTADGKSCTFLAELFVATEDECLSEQNLPDEPIEGHTYTALGKINYDDFSKCFKGLFN